MATDTWEIERDIGLARLNGNAAEVTRLLRVLTTHRDTCDHLFYVPEGGLTVDERCWKCGRKKSVEEQREREEAVTNKKAEERIDAIGTASCADTEGQYCPSQK